jgi:hypothetical protein
MSSADTPNNQAVLFILEAPDQWLNRNSFVFNNAQTVSS